MARTKKATDKSKKRRKEASDDWKAFKQKCTAAGFDDEVEPDSEVTPRPAQSGLVVKRPGMDDLSLDELSNCPKPEDALLLLSADAAEAMQAVPEHVRIEVCKTIVALGDVVARTHAPLLAAIKLTVGEGGGILTTAEANGRIFFRRGDGNLVAAFSGAICAFARSESKQQSGWAHAESLMNWAHALVEAGQYLADIAATARSIGAEIAKQQAVCGKVNSPEGMETFSCGRPEGHEGWCSPYITSQDAPPEYRRGTGPVYRSEVGQNHGPQEVHSKVTPARIPGRGGVPMCALDDGCVQELGHGGPCCSYSTSHGGPCTTNRDPHHSAIPLCGRHSLQGRESCVRPEGHKGSCALKSVPRNGDLSKCGKFSCPEAPEGCILPEGHEGRCTGVDTNKPL